MTRSSNVSFDKLNLEISSNFRSLLRIYELYLDTYLSKELGNQKKASVPVDWVWQFLINNSFKTNFNLNLIEKRSLSLWVLG